MEWHAGFIKSVLAGMLWELVSVLVMCSFQNVDDHHRCCSSCHGRSFRMRSRPTQQCCNRRSASLREVDRALVREHWQFNASLRRAMPRTQHLFASSMRTPCLVQAVQQRVRRLLSHRSCAAPCIVGPRQIERPRSPWVLRGTGLRLRPAARAALGRYVCREPNEELNALTVFSRHKSRDGLMRHSLRAMHDHAWGS